MDTNAVTTGNTDDEESGDATEHEYATRDEAAAAIAAPVRLP